MNLFLRLLAILLASVAAVRADDFAEASAHYAAGRYAEAAAQWEQLIKAEGPSAARLYNLGNARARQEEFGQAILAYERALLLAPRDPDILANLALARKNASSPEPAARAWWREPLHLLSLNEWSWLLASGAVLLAAGLMNAGIRGFRNPLSLRILTGTGIAAILSLLPASLALLLRRDETHRALLTAREPVLRLSPFSKADEVARPAPGTPVRLGERARGWVQVELRDSAQRGWVPESAAARLAGD